MVGNEKNVEGKKITAPGAQGGIMKALVSPKEGWEGYVMRVLEIEAGGCSPKHAHNWPHINYCIEGEGELEIDGVKNQLTAGGFAYIPSNSEHQFKNTGGKLFKFICIVPEEGHK